MDYIIELDTFEGPFDLLLHLIKKNDMKIEEIRIELIIEQYMDYLHKLEELNLNIAGEYLVMAAELMEIKSKILLPKVEEEIEEDPKQQFIERLIAYKTYKEVTEEFKDLEQKRKEIFTKTPTDLNQFKKEELVLFDQASIDLLVDAFKSMIQKQQLDKPIDTKITTKEYSLQVRNKEIKSILKKNKKVAFEELFEEFTKDYFVVTFLSILDLSKRQELEIVQENNFSKIFLVNKGD